MSKAPKPTFKFKKGDRVRPSAAAIKGCVIPATQACGPTRAVVTGRFGKLGDHQVRVRIATHALTAVYHEDWWELDASDIIEGEAKIKALDREFNAIDGKPYSDELPKRFAEIMKEHEPRVRMLAHEAIEAALVIVHERLGISAAELEAGKYDGVERSVFSTGHATSDLMAYIRAAARTKAQR